MDFRINVKATDMDEDDLKRVQETATKAFETCRQEKQLANYIKTEFDKSSGVGWNCIVGRNFGSHVCHQTNKYIYFSVKDVFVLLWKA